MKKFCVIITLKAKTIRGKKVMKVFEKIQSFVSSLGEYVKNFSNLFLIFVGAFALLTVVIIFITSFAYECKLTKTVDKINKFLERNPKINDDNLVTFNNMLKARSVPKALRRQWQQFMLYREHPASYYMSFKHCVENPLRNSTYQQQMTVYKVISYILVVLSFVVSIFMAQQSHYTSVVFQEIIIIPLVILVCYWVVSMILNLVHSAISGDLFQNYQYFEINMDKAMLTLPEFVDYEVLFSQDEIRRGIPVLFAYLQKRAIQEQQELEKARLKSVDHEKFDFDKAGLDGSLVLERAMRETENFASQRKKYLQEIERVNNEINVLENNYKEQTKEFQRQVQASKETVENLKEQLEQATSTIEINYIKKQMRDELTRQQLAEKDYDILTDKQNQSIKALNQEVKRYYDEIAAAKEALQAAMLSEFNTYSIKVYDNLEKIVDEKMQGKVDDFKGQIKGLETELEEKNEELENVYVRYQEVLSQVPADNQDVAFVDETLSGKKSKKKKKGDNNDDEGMVQPGVDEYNQFDYPQNSDQQYYDDQNYQQYDNYQDVQGDYQDNQVDNYQDGQYNDYQNVDGQYDNQYADQYQYNDNAEFNNGQYVDNQDYANDTYQQYDNYDSTGDSYIPLDENQPVDSQQDEYGYVPTFDNNQAYTPSEFNQFDDVIPDLDNQGSSDDYGEYIPLADESQSSGEYIPLADEQAASQTLPEKAKEDVSFDGDDFDIDFSQPSSKEDKPDEDFNFDFGTKAEGTPASDDEDFDLNDLFGFYDDKKEEPKEEPKEKVEAPDEELDEEPEDDVKTEVKVAVEEELDESDEDDDSDDEGEFLDDEDALVKPVAKRKAGRPRKIVDETEQKPKRKVGRPRKVVDETEQKPKRKPGRPRKTTVIDDDDIEVVVETKRKPGRPKKTETAAAKPATAKKVADANEVLEAPKRKAGRPKKIVVKVEVTPKRKPGRPKKVEATATAEAPKRKPGRPKKS